MGPWCDEEIPLSMLAAANGQLFVESYPAAALPRPDAGSLRRRFEIPQIRRRLVLLGGHQKPFPAEEIVLLADHDLGVVFDRVELHPVGTRVRVVHVSLVDGPRP